MRNALPAILVLALAVVAAPTAATTPRPRATPAPKLSTPPPLIGHVVSRPFCTALRTHIGPAVGHILASDNIIKQGPPLFKDYNYYNGNGDMSDGAKQLTLVKMENMVTPLVKNIAAVEDALHDDAIFHNPPHTADEKRLLVMRDQLENVLAMQKASLDIVNGFVDTQQLGDMQHEGFGYIGAINGDVPVKGDVKATPNPLLQDPNAPGLPPDTHFIDPATIPGLTLGYNPITRLNEGLEWTRSQAHANENVAAKSVMEAVRLCGGHAPGGAPAAGPTATPTP